MTFEFEFEFEFELRFIASEGREGNGTSAYSAAALANDYHMASCAPVSRTGDNLSTLA